MPHTPPTTAARYTPDRDPVTGHFKKGNRVALANHAGAAKRFQELRANWYGANSVEDMPRMKAELVRLCLEASSEDVRLRAIVYYLDRTLGRPTERVEMGVQGAAPAPLAELTAEEVTVLQRVVQRSIS